jgi:hypothetical protein
MEQGLTKLDLEFAKITWIVNQKYDTLNKEEIQLLKYLFQQYCEYARGDDTAKRNVSKFIRELVELSKTDVKVTMPTVLKQEQTVFGMTSRFGIGEEEEQENQDLQVSFKGQVVKPPSGKQVQEQFFKISNSSAGKKLRREAEKLSPDSSVELLKQMARQQVLAQEEARANFGALNEFMILSAGNDKLIEVQYHELKKDMKKMQQEINELHAMQLAKQSLTDLKWHQIPDWFKEIYSAGLKRTAFNLVKLPLKIATVAVDRIIYRPMVRSYDFWGGKIELVLGTVLWIVVIAGVVHVYQQTDWQSVNDTYKAFGGEYINRYVFAGTDILREIPKYFPNATQLFASSKDFFYENIAVPIVQLLYLFLNTIYALLTASANVAIRKLPYADWWFTPREVLWPDSPLAEGLKQWFEV